MLIISYQLLLENQELQGEMSGSFHTQAALYIL